MKLEKRQEDTVAKITTMEVRDDGVIINAQANMPAYGNVRFSINLESGGDRSSGFCHGAGRGALQDGTFFSGVFSGRWVREGTIAKIRYVVEISNGDQNLDMVEFDATSDELKIEHYALN
ncbi:MAG: hypothetical protein CL917_08875 [Deltaproteobacteria bacterium]|nr:hypothetical protein [Deltaproteobacteria bacterium]